MRVAIIPARGGSKRIPKKNIRIVNKLPMIAWSIKAAQDTKVFDRIFVSTDDLEIADVAVQYGAEIPFIRPQNISDDYASTMAVIKHAVDWLLSENIPVTEVCCIYATAPTIRPSDIVKGLHALNSHPENKFSYSVAEHAAPIQRALKINRYCKLEMFYPRYVNSRSQDLASSYFDAAQFYWGYASSWLTANHIFLQPSSPIVVPRQFAVDIDTEDDLKHLEIIMKVMEFYTE